MTAVIDRIIMPNFLLYYGKDNLTSEKYLSTVGLAPAWATYRIWKERQKCRCDAEAEKNSVVVNNTRCLATVSYVLEFGSNDTTIVWLISTMTIPSLRSLCWELRFARASMVTYKRKMKKDVSFDRAGTESQTVWYIENDLSRCRNMCRSQLRWGLDRRWRNHGLEIGDNSTKVFDEKQFRLPVPGIMTRIGPLSIKLRSHRPSADVLFVDYFLGTL